MWYKYQVHFLADTGEDTENVEDRHREGVVDVIVDKRLDGGGGLDGDEPARTAIMDQDRAISEKSGLPPLAIKTIKRSGK